jgi:hypothetical protein
MEPATEEPSFTGKRATFTGKGTGRRTGAGTVYLLKKEENWDHTVERVLIT